MLKVFTAFSGYDSQCMALDSAGINYDLVGWSEIDKWAILAHNAVYPQYENRNYGDISQIDWKEVPDFDLFTYSFPCTNISSAGRTEGLERGSGTASSLLWECERAIREKRPKYLLMENVKNLASKKFMPYFEEWLKVLDELGYFSTWKILDASDYGVPQHRERVFCVSVLDEWPFQFPEPRKLEKCFSDYLVPDEDSTRADQRSGLPEIIDKARDTYDATPKEKKIIKLGNRLASGYCHGKVIHPYGVAPTVMENHGETTLVMVKTKEGELIVRKTSPYECFALMGVSDENIKKIMSAVPYISRQLILAGNSIVVDVMVAIFKKLFKK